MNVFSNNIVLSKLSLILTYIVDKFWEIKATISIGFNVEEINNYFQP